MRSRKFARLLIVWIIAGVIAALGFQLIWNRLPEFSNTVQMLLIYGVLALPQSFLHLVTWETDAVIYLRGWKLLLVLIAYWGVLGWLQIRYLRRGSGAILMILVIIILLSAPRWLYYAVGMSGI